LEISTEIFETEDDEVSFCLEIIKENQRQLEEMEEEDRAIILDYKRKNN